jgi:hypothetical protein
MLVHDAFFYTPDARSHYMLIQDTCCPVKMKEAMFWKFQDNSVGFVIEGLSNSALQIDVGDEAPSFTLKDQNGRDVSLSKFKGKPTVLYFYPKDDTPGCTKQVSQ